MASNDKTGPEDEVEGSWSPKRPRSKAAAKTTSSDPEVLAQEIEQTREELAETLDAIADKVSPKKVVGRTKKAAKDGATDAVEAVKGTAASAVESLKGSVAAAKGETDSRVTSAQVPVEPAPTPGALADAASTVTMPAGSETPYVAPYSSPLPPPTPSRVPVFAGAGALLLLLLVLKRRRR